MRKLLVLTTLMVVNLIGLTPTLAQTQVELPALTGPYAVGRATYDWTDNARQDPFLADINQLREVVAKIYYPADEMVGITSTPYVEGLEEDVLAMALHLPVDVVRTDLRAHAVTEAVLSNKVATYPVVIFTGDISGTALYYSSLLEDIASHGYVVVALSHPYSNQFAVLYSGRVAFAVESGNPNAAKTAAGRDKVGEIWKSDVMFVRNQLEQMNTDDPRFAGYLDLANVAIIGHGFGGAVALSTLASDPRFTAGISLDGRVLGDTISKTLNNPAMFIDPASESLRPLDEKAALDQIKANSKSSLYNVQVTGTSGTTFVTDVDILNSVFTGGVKTDTLSLATGSPISIIRSYTVAFLDKHLKGEDVPLLDSVNENLSGVEVEIIESQSP